MQSALTTRMKVPLLVLLTALCVNAALAQTPPHASDRKIPVHGHYLAFHVTQGRSPVLVLDAGGGADSSYWNSIIPRLEKATGSEIITYDRSGFGASDEVPPPFRMQEAVTDLESGLEQLGATHDLVLVPHSFAGEIATYLAIRHPNWISGAVLVDTNVPDFFTDAEISRLNPLMQPLIAAHPDKRTRTLEAIQETYVPTSQDFHKAAWPAAIPCVVILSEGTPFPPQMKQDSELWTQAHIDFASHTSNRVLIIAKGSSHDVAHDRPDIIIHAITDLLNQLKSKSK